MINMMRQRAKIFLKYLGPRHVCLPYVCVCLWLFPLDMSEYRSMYVQNDLYEEKKHFMRI